MNHNRQSWRRELVGLAFLLPGLTGLIGFIILPLGLSLILAFTNWDVRLHNLFRDGELVFAGLDNFARMLRDERFWRYLGNTLFLMLAIPVAIAGSLGTALLLTAAPAPGGILRRGYWLATGGLLVGAVGMLLAGGTPGQVAGLLGILLAGLLLGGGLGGATFYRTVFYLPHFTAGIATYLLWKKMLQGEQSLLSQVTYGLASGWRDVAAWLPSAGWVALAMVSITGTALCHRHRPARAACISLAAGALIALCAPAADWRPPNWLGDYHWAKPSLMLVSIWTAVGSNNMLLYLAGLASVPKELIEAAALDGANGWQRFRHVTWPQLAPVTFFIVTMSVIGGFQGGFEMARAMTDGGPAGATTTLAYFIFNQGFEDGDLAYASALAWALFLLIGVATWLQWRCSRRL